MTTRNETRKRTRLIAVSAMLVALGEVLLYLSSILPTASLALVAMAGLLPAIAVIMGGAPTGLTVFAATAALALVIVPDKGAVAVYALLFGHYPVVKSLAERTKSRIVEWAIKLGVFNALLTVAVFAASALVFGFLQYEGAKWLVYLVGNVVFVIYDFGFSGLITMFLGKFGKILGRQ